MNEQLFDLLPRALRRPGNAQLLGVVAGLVLGGPAVLAAQATAQLDVVINLRPAETRTQTGICDSTGAANGTATPTIICEAKPGTQPSKLRSAYPGGSYSFISYITGPAGSVDIYTGTGTSTAFRLVNWADREYIEMTVGW